VRRRLLKLGREIVAVWVGVLLSTGLGWPAPRPESPDPNKVACIQMGILDTLHISVRGDAVNLRRLAAPEQDTRLAALKPNDLPVVDDNLLSNQAVRSKLRESSVALFLASDSVPAQLSRLLATPTGVPGVFIVDNSPGGNRPPHGGENGCQHDGWRSAEVGAGITAARRSASREQPCGDAVPGPPPPP
jgi:hypothetical protein